jgi:hypothetical protein
MIKITFYKPNIHLNDNRNNLKKLDILRQPTIHTNILKTFND